MRRTANGILARHDLGNAKAADGKELWTVLVNDFAQSADDLAFPFRLLARRQWHVIDENGEG
jgi:hypothetical protein